MRARLHRAYALVLAAACAFAPASLAQRAPVVGHVVFDEPSGAHDIPFTLNSDKMYVAVTIDGRGPYSLVIDTGSGGMILDSRVTRELEMPLGETFRVTGAGADPFPLAPVERTVDVELPGMYMLEQPAFSGPIDSVVGPYEGRVIDGVLGCANLFIDYVVELDYAGERMNVWELSAYEPAEGALALAVEVREGHAFVRGSVQPLRGEPVTGEFIVDTGLRGTGLMHTPFVTGNDLIARSAPTVYATVGGGIGGRATAHVGRVRSLTLDGVTVEDIYLSFSQATSGLISTDYCSGIVGSAVLQRYRVAFDYPRGRILLWPADFDAERLDFDKSGMFLVTDVADRSRVRVADVIADAPAARAGLAVGDVIVAVDGHRPADSGLEAIRRMLRAAAGTVYEVEYERAGERRSTRLTLRRVV